MKYISVVLIVALLGLPLQAESREQGRVRNAGTVMKEILEIPDGIPQQLLDKAECVIVLPSVVKLAFVFGASYGRGVMTCRSGEFSGKWGAPTMMALEGGSFGLQMGAQATDYVFLVMNQRGADSILSSKVKLGAGISASAGPVGRDAAAATDAAFRAEILSYSRSRGLFAGAFLDGSTLRPDNDANWHLYKRSASAKAIALQNGVPPPASALELLSQLDKHSPRNLSSSQSAETNGGRSGGQQCRNHNHCGWS